MGLFDGTVDKVTENLKPILAEAEKNIAAAVSFAIQDGIDRLKGMTVTIKIDFPEAKPKLANPPTN